MNTLGEDIIASLKEAVEYKRGKLTQKDGISVHQYPVPDQVDVRSIRRGLGLTQEEFAQFGFSVRSIQNWENHRRTPEGPARVLLHLIQKKPDVVLEVLHSSS